VAALLRRLLVMVDERAADAETARTVALQALANAATGHPLGAEAVWAAIVLATDVLQYARLGMDADAECVWDDDEGVGGVCVCVGCSDVAVGGSVKAAGLAVHVLAAVVDAYPACRCGCGAVRVQGAAGLTKGRAESRSRSHRKALRCWRRCCDVHPHCTTTRARPLTSCAWRTGA
jgi:hypothetical protein